MRTEKEIRTMIKQLEEDLKVPKLSKTTNNKIISQIKALQWILKEE